MPLKNSCFSFLLLTSCIPKWYKSWYFADWHSAHTLLEASGSDGMFPVSALRSVCALSTYRPIQNSCLARHCLWTGTSLCILLRSVDFIPHTPWVLSYKSSVRVCEKLPKFTLGVFLPQTKDIQFVWVRGSNSVVVFNFLWTHVCMSKLYDELVSCPSCVLHILFWWDGIRSFI